MENEKQDSNEVDKGQKAPKSAELIAIEADIKKRISDYANTIGHAWRDATALAVEVIQHALKHEYDCSLCGKFVNTLAFNHESDKVRAFKKLCYDGAGISCTPDNKNVDKWICTKSKMQAKKLAESGEGTVLLKKVSEEGLRSILKTNTAKPPKKSSGIGNVKGMIEVMAEGLEAGIHFFKETETLKPVASDFEHKLQALYMEMKDTLRAYNQHDMVGKMLSFESKAIKNEAKNVAENEVSPELMNDIIQKKEGTNS